MIEPQVPHEYRGVTLRRKRTRFSLFNAPAYFTPNSFMYEVRNGRVDVADYHKAECDINSSSEEVNYREV